MATGKPRGPGISFGNSAFNGWTAPKKSGDFADPRSARRDWEAANEEDPEAVGEQHVAHPKFGRGNAVRLDDDN